MPKAMEAKLRKIAEKYARAGKLRRKPKEPLKRAKDRFVYGTMKNKGLM